MIGRGLEEQVGMGVLRVVTGRHLKISLPLTNEQHGLGTSRFEQGLDPLRLNAVQGWCCLDARLQKWCVLLLTSQLAPF